MRSAACSSFARGTLQLGAACLLSCGSTKSSSTAAEGGTPLVDASFADAIAQQPDTQTCTGDSSLCLFGSAQTDGFTIDSTRLKALRVRLYRGLPPSRATDNNPVIAEQLVAKDHTWAFASLSQWGHYYVAFEPGFSPDAAVTSTVTTRVGPLAVPNHVGSIDVRVKPVALDVFEQNEAGVGSTDSGVAPMFVQAAVAHLFDPATGNELQGGATVSIAVGSTTTPMPWTTFPSGSSAYYVQFPMLVPAQATYQIMTSLGAGANQTALNPGKTWILIAPAADFPPAAVTSPASGATFPVNTDLMVAWSSQQPAADYVQLKLLQSQGGSWVGVYTSDPAPVDVTRSTIPASQLTVPGTYEVGVAMSKANCPPTADGCVHASAIAIEPITVQ